MTITALDLTPSPSSWVGDQVLAGASALFDAVKSAPLEFRSQFPKVLRNNNFALAVHVTRKFIFLEVTGKFRAQRTREGDRLRAYRQIFTTQDSGEPAVFAIANSRLIRVAGLTAQAPHAFALGDDISMCAWDVRSTAEVAGRLVSQDIDIIYVVGFGKTLNEQNCWQEFDSLIRVTLSHWSGMR